MAPSFTNGNGNCNCNGNGNGYHDVVVPLVSEIETTDVCDANAPLLVTGELQVLQSIFQSYGRRPAFSGRVVTVKSFEDNALVIKTLFDRTNMPEPKPKVLVVDAGGSRNRAMLGGLFARLAHDYGWAGVVVNGSIRDIDEINNVDVGVWALGPVPVRSKKKGGGERHVTVQFAGAIIRDGDWLCADSSGILVSNRELSGLGPTHEPVCHFDNTDSFEYSHVMADYTSPVEPNRLFTAHFLDDHHFLPTYLPEMFKSVEFLRGDTTEVGCIKLVNFAKGNQFTYVKNRVDELDVESMYIKYTTIEGDILGDMWDYIVYEINVQPSATGSHYKMTGHYHTKRSDIMTKEKEVTILREGLKTMHKVIQECLCIYPHIYARS